tara:strand:+ start:1038 stop:1625 length:588 start_codon:yes stop_codon:yes gene_type:complete
MADVKMDISAFKSNFDGGSRPNRFVITGEVGSLTNTTTPINNIVVKAGQMPESQLGIITVPFRGRAIKIPGDRTYSEWTFSILDSFSESTNFRRKFEEWNTAFNQHKENTPDPSAVNEEGGLDFSNANLFTDWNVSQLSIEGNVVRTVSLHKCWPVQVGAIDLTYDAGDTLTEYTVTLAYDYITLAEPTQAQNIK